MFVKTINVSEATPIQLDWLVAKCEGLQLHKNSMLGGVFKRGWWVSGLFTDSNKWVRLTSKYAPSTDWAQAGPIIEREEMGFAKYGPNGTWKAVIGATPRGAPHFGPTPLIAVMRCYVASIRGETVEVPEEL